MSTNSKSYKNSQKIYKPLFSTKIDKYLRMKKHTNSLRDSEFSTNASVVAILILLGTAGHKLLTFSHFKLHVDMSFRYTNIETQSKILVCLLVR